MVSCYFYTKRGNNVQYFDQGGPPLCKTSYSFVRAVRSSSSAGVKFDDI